MLDFTNYCADMHTIKQPTDLHKTVLQSIHCIKIHFDAYRQQSMLNIPTQEGDTITYSIGCRIQ